MSLFRNRAFDAVVIAGSLSNVVFCLVAVFSALYLQQARGMSPFNAGLVFLALSAGAGSASFYSGRLAEKFPADRLMAIGMLISAAGIVGLTSVDVALALHAAVPRDRRRPRAWAGRCRNVATQAVVPLEYVGAASGVTLTALVMLGAVGVAIAAAMLELIAGSPQAAASDAAAINIVLRAGAALAVVGAVALLLFGRRAPAAARFPRRRPSGPLTSPLNATTFCFCSPRPSMPSVTTSPAFRHCGGFMPSPTPGGVPVVIDVARQQRHVLRDVGDELARRRRSSCFVLPVCRRSPLTSSHMSRFCGSLISSVVTSHGPIGPNVSQPLPLFHCDALFFIWNSRSDTSLITQ